MKTPYLLAYNFAQAGGWAYALLLLGRELQATGGRPEGAYAAAGEVVRICQAVSFLEVVHAAVGLVRSPVSSALMQWGGRSNVLFAVLHATPEIQQSPAVAVMIFVWALIEIVRYPWYGLSALGVSPAALTWLRYTLFIPLYPIGVVAEIVLMVQSLPFLESKQLHSFSMPNKFNFAFNYHYFIIGLLCAYPFLWWQLYSMMFSQRRKRLGAEKAKHS